MSINFYTAKFKFNRNISKYVLQILIVYFDKLAVTFFFPPKIQNVKKVKSFVCFFKKILKAWKYENKHFKNSVSEFIRALHKTMHTEHFCSFYFLLCPSVSGSNMETRAGKLHSIFVRRKENESYFS